MLVELAGAYSNELMSWWARMASQTAACSRQSPVAVPATPVTFKAKITSSLPMLWFGECPLKTQVLTARSSDGGTIERWLDLKCAHFIHGSTHWWVHSRVGCEEVGPMEGDVPLKGVSCLWSFLLLSLLPSCHGGFPLSWHTTSTHARKRSQPTMDWNLRSHRKSSLS
jgi:hypothetical protein